MKLFFDHIAGQQTDKDFLHCLVSATFERFEYDWALQNGWSPSNIWYDNDTNFVRDHDMIWYQSRQTRINLSRSEPHTQRERKARKQAKHTAWTQTSEPDFDQLYRIYVDYLYNRGFSDSMNFDDFLRSYSTQENLVFLLFEDCAFSVLEEVGNSLIAHQFCWNYSRPQLGLGKYATYIEIEYARSKLYDSVYLGPSYESMSSYKASFSGFEWWTGREWSTDTDAYTECLQRDDSVRTINDLVQEYTPYFRRLNI
jgi:hypothetical protein